MVAVRKMTEMLAHLSSCVSVLAIAACFFYVPYLVSRMDEIKGSLVVKMDQFKVI